MTTKTVTTLKELKKAIKDDSETIIVEGDLAKKLKIFYRQKAAAIKSSDSGSLDPETIIAIAAAIFKLAMAIVVLFALIKNYEEIEARGGDTVIIFRRKQN